MSNSNNATNKTEARDGFSLFRLSFSQNSFELEKGELSGGSVHFTSVAESKLLFAFEPSILRFPDNIDSLIGILQESLGQWLNTEDRFAIILPKEWGFTFDIPYPGDIDEEDLKHHVLWASKTNSWEDPEKLHLNYRKIEGDKIRISGVRQRVIDFAHELADQLSFRLLQLSLVETTYLNLIAPDALSTTDTEETDSEDVEEHITEEEGEETQILEEEELETEAEVEEEAAREPEEESDIISFDELEPKDDVEEEEEEEEEFEEEVSAPEEELVHQAPKKKAPYKSLIWIFIVLIIGAGGYLGYTYLGDEVREFAVSIWTKSDSLATLPSEDNISSDSIMNSEEPDNFGTVRAQDESLFYSLPKMLRQNGDLKFLSMTGDLVRCEIGLPGTTEIDQVLDLLGTSGLVYSAVCPFAQQIGNIYSAIITCRIDENILNTYRHPPIKEVFDLIADKGFRVNRGVYNGNIEGIEQILHILDENKIILYRIVIAQENQNRYSLSLEY